MNAFIIFYKKKKSKIRKTLGLIYTTRPKKKNLRKNVQRTNKIIKIKQIENDKKKEINKQ